MKFRSAIRTFMRASIRYTNGRVLSVPPGNTQPASLPRFLRFKSIALDRAGKLENAVRQWLASNQVLLPGVVLAIHPGFPVALLGEQVLRSLEVTCAEPVHPGPSRHIPVLFAQPRCDLLHTAGFQLIHQPA